MILGYLSTVPSAAVTFPRLELLSFRVLFAFFSLFLTSYLTPVFLTHASSVLFQSRPLETFCGIFFSQSARSSIT